MGLPEIKKYQNGYAKKRIFIFYLSHDDVIAVFRRGTWIYLLIYTQFFNKKENKYLHKKSSNKRQKKNNNFYILNLYLKSKKC